MAMKSYPPNTQMDEILNILNLIFTGIFNFEYILKQIALGNLYFSDGLNVFDLIVVLASDTGIIVEQAFGVSIGTATTAIRTFRILRILRLIKKAKTLKLLIDTLIFILPSLVSTGSLLFMGLFIFTALGMNLFGTIRYWSYTTFGVNFSSFQYSFMLLMRCASGDNWN